MRSYWVRVGPVTGVLNGREEFGHRHTGRMPCDNGSKVGVGARTALRIASNPHEQRRLLPQSPPGERGDTLLWTPNLQNTRGYISILKPPSSW